VARLIRGEEQNGVADFAGIDALHRERVHEDRAQILVTPSSSTFFSASRSRTSAGV
jgi:hypothetical protein